MWCEAEGQSDGCDGGSGLEEAAGKRQLLIDADDEGASEEEREVHHHDRRGGSHGTAVDASSVKLHALTLTEGRDGVRHHQREGGRLHTTGRGSW